MLRAPTHPNEMFGGLPVLPPYSGQHTTARDVIADINRAVSRRERFEALQKAHAFFSHDNVELHDHEVELGADKALCLKLGYMLHDQCPEELVVLLDCLYLIYQCSDPRRLQSFLEIGQSDILPLLLQVWRKNHTAIPIVSVSILRLYSKINAAVKSVLIRHPALLPNILLILQTTTTSTEVKEEMLRFLKDLVFRAHDHDKEYLFQCHHDHLVPVLCSFLDPSVSTKLQETSTAVLWNLALVPNLSVQLSNRPGMVQLLGGILKENAGVRTRRNAISVLGNLVLQSELGVVNENWLLGVLMHCVRYDQDMDTRRRGMRTIRCMCSGERGTRIRRHEDIVPFLTATIQADFDRITKIQAYETIGCIVQDSARMQEIGPLLEHTLLQSIELADDAGLTVAASRTLLMCIENSPWTRASSCFSAAFFDSVDKAISFLPNDAPAHHCISQLFMLACKQEGMLECRSTLANTLAQLLSREGPDFEQSRNAALDVVIELMKSEDNLRPMVENEGLLTALVNYALSAQGSRRDSAKKAILSLVPQL